MQENFKAAISVLRIIVNSLSNRRIALEDNMTYKQNYIVYLLFIVFIITLFLLLLRYYLLLY